MSGTLPPLPQYAYMAWCLYLHGAESASKEIPCLLWEPKVRYRVKESSPLDPILGQTNPVHALFLKGSILILSPPQTPQRGPH